MSALSTYSATNRVIDSGKAVTYSKTRISGSWTYSSGVGITNTTHNAWQYVRHCTKTYRYVGLSQEAAATCAAAMIAMYTRTTEVSDVKTGIVSTSEIFHDIDGGSTVMAHVDARYDGAGQLWTVCISVDEIDTRLRSLSSYSPTVIFATENNRDYDED